MDWEWIDRDASAGPLFRVGPDTYVRDRADRRVVRLTTTYSPGVDYIQPAIDAFTETARHWGAPVLFVLQPDVKKPPAVRFLFEWSQACAANGSVERAWFLMGGRISRMVGSVVGRAFTGGGMPFEAVAGRGELDTILDGFDLACPQPGYTPPAEASTALATRRALGDGVYGQLVKRIFRRASGSAG